jgi:hypothetical protein
MINFKYFVKEILRGKTLYRAFLSAGLIKLFQDENWLNDQFSVLELGAEPASHQRTFPKSW